ncbi:mitochondrial-processing peptidase subunit alpha-like [Quillaja saponaria]|uniref:Mitochondrial-processing peptidase subunit alpha-like n=1 Tax=Quillaja saponaria TaxID=32244 RepID=A0AAD7PW48_QUISA|nr:mitochondrial-processing peptidase subunit alpha-like [Quillaja saponaria]
MVLAAFDVEHEELLSIAEPLLDSGITHFALASELPGGWHKLKDAMVLTCTTGIDNVHFICFLCLRCYWEVVDLSQPVDLGKGCIHVSGSDFVSRAIDIAANTVIPGEVTARLRQRANKVCNCDEFGLLLVSRQFSVRTLQHVVLFTPLRNFSVVGKPMDHFLKAADEVTVKDIASISQKLFSSPLTVASYGDVLYVPSSDAVGRKFHSK